MCASYNSVSHAAHCVKSSAHTCYGMAWPFTPLVTFLSSPSEGHTFLNSLQSAVNAIFAPVYHRRPSIYVQSTNEPGACLCRFADRQGFGHRRVRVHRTSRPHRHDPWPASAWRYLYLVSTSGVASVEVSKHRAGNRHRRPLFKTGDETRRYLCAVRCDPGGNVVKFNMIDGRYLWLADNQVLTGSVGTGSWGTLDMSTFVAPHARRVHPHGSYHQRLRVDWRCGLSFV